MTKIHCGDYTCRFRNDKDFTCGASEIALEMIGNKHVCMKYEPTESYMDYLRDKENKYGNES